jgi:nicotinic acid mononucleotide adenylyltransferase
MPMIAISSSLVRERMRLGRSVRYLVPPGVADLLAAEGG